MRIHSRLRFTIIALCVAVFAAGPVAGGAEPADPFPKEISAPSLSGGVEWLNCGGPIELRDLRGKVVVLDFWTYCCINCIHILPALHELEKKYNRELVVIGVHSAKFENEKDSDAIREAILRYDITHPVVNDANMKIWRKYGVNSWPTLVLIDPQGNYCGRVSGEGRIDVLDKAIQQVIAYHNAKGTLDRTPIDFALAKEKVEPTPLRYPGKVLADAESDRLYISDNNHNRIVITTLDGKLVDTIGSGRVGQADGNFATAEFNHPQGMALAGGKLYVADTRNHLIRVVDLQKKTVSTLAGTGKQAGFREKGGALKATPLNSPWDLLIHNGGLYIAMAGSHQIWVHPLGSDKIGVFAGTGREDIIDGPHAKACFAQPSGLATDGQALYVCASEGSAIRRVPFNRSQPVTTVAGPSDLPGGRSLFTFGDKDGIGDNVRLQHPIGIEFYNNTFFIADSYNHKIKAMTLTPAGVGRVKTLYGDGESGDNLKPLELAEPAGLDAAGNTLFIADTNNHRIVTVNTNTGKADRLKIQGLQPPAAATEAEPPPLASTKAITVPRQSVQGGREVPVTVNVTLPEGFKLNPAYPVGATATGTGMLVPQSKDPDRLPAEATGTAINFKIPLSRTNGSDTLRITVRYGYCRDGTGGICKVKTLRWNLPLTLANGGNKKIHLKTPPASSQSAAGAPERELN